MELAYPVLFSTVILPVVLSPLVYLASKEFKENTGWLTFLILLYPLLISSYALITGTTLEDPPYLRSIVTGPFKMIADDLSIPFYFTIALISAIVAIYSIPYMKHRIEESGEELPGYGSYYSLYLLYAAGMLGTVLATNLLEFYIYFELMLIPSFLHIALWGYGERGRIAIMYFLWTHVGAVALLIGIVATRVYTGSFVINELARIGLDKLSGTIPVGWLAFAMALGLLVKMAVFGVHIWLPYAHAEAPTPISALLSPIMIGIGGYALARIIIGIFPLTFTSVSMYLSILAIVTMAYGALMAMSQDDFKRFLAYSSVSQMGYILFGLSTINTLGITGGMVQYVSHGLGKAVLFMTAGIMIMEGHGLRSISKMGGLAKRMPITATLAIIGFLTIAGIPPLVGFHAEWPILTGIFGKAIKTMSITDFWIGVLAAIGTTMTVGYAVWAIRRIFFGPLPEHLNEFRDPPAVVLLPLAILAVLSVIFGLDPDPLYKLLYSYARGLGLIGG